MSVMERNLITLVKYRYEYRAEILKARLEEAGIECSISNESVLGQIDGVKVMIFEDDYEKAVAIYRKIRDLYDNPEHEIIDEPNHDK